MGEPLRVLLVDDHAIFRKGLAGLIASRQEDGIVVVGEADDGLDALEKARELMPDLILMDVRMPRCDGVRATRLIKEEMPYVRIVMLTISDEEEDVFKALEAGAQGYLLKDMSPEALFEVLKGVAQGDAPLSPAIAARIIQEFRRSLHEGAHHPGKSMPLSPREREILQMVVNGLSNEEIAAKLFITRGTVKNHLHNILAKLQMKNRAQAIAYAVHEGLVHPPDKAPE